MRSNNWVQIVTSMGEGNRSRFTKVCQSKHRISFSYRTDEGVLMLVLYKLTAYSLSPSTSALGSTGSPATRCFSAAQSPRSMSLQRSEQKGRKALSEVHVSFLPQFGHAIFFFWIVIFVFSG